VEADDRHEYRNNKRNILDQIGARRANCTYEKCEWHGIQQHHPVEDRGFLRHEVVAPSSHETEEQRTDDRSQCAQNSLYHGDPFAARCQNYRIARTISTMKSKCETLVMALLELIFMLCSMNISIKIKNALPASNNRRIPWLTPQPTAPPSRSHCPRNKLFSR